MQDNWTIIGRLMGPFGIKGEMRVLIEGLDLEILRADKIPIRVSKNDKVLTIKYFRHATKHIIMSFNEITDRNIAETFPKSSLEIETQYFQNIKDDDYNEDDYIGFTLKDLTGDTYGKIIDIVNYGAGDIMEIVSVDGKKIMVPIDETIILDILQDDSVLIVSGLIKNYIHL